MCMLSGQALFDAVPLPKIFIGLYIRLLIVNKGAFYKYINTFISILDTNLLLKIASLSPLSDTWFIYFIFNHSCSATMTCPHAVKLTVQTSVPFCGLRGYKETPDIIRGEENWLRFLFSAQFNIEKLPLSYLLWIITVLRFHSKKTLSSCFLGHIIFLLIFRLILYVYFYAEIKIHVFQLSFL